MDDRFTIDQLDASARSRACDKHRSINVEYNDWYEHVKHDAVVIGSHLGIAITDLMFSGFYSQGDGASFVGRYSAEESAIDRVKEHAPQDIALHAIAERLTATDTAIALIVPGRIITSITHSGHYYHSGCMRFEHDHEDNIDISECEELLDRRAQCLEDFADWIYQQLEAEYDYQTEDAQVISTLREITFVFDELGHTI